MYYFCVLIFTYLLFATITLRSRGKCYVISVPRNSVALFTTAVAPICYSELFQTDQFRGLPNLQNVLDAKKKSFRAHQTRLTASCCIFVPRSTQYSTKQPNVLINTSQKNQSPAFSLRHDAAPFLPLPPPPPHRPPYRCKQTLAYTRAHWYMFDTTTSLFMNQIQFKRKVPQILVPVVRNLLRGYRGITNWRVCSAKYSCLLG